MEIERGEVRTLYACYGEGLQQWLHESPDESTKLVIDLLENQSYMKVLALLDLQYGNIRSEYRSDLVESIHFAAQFGLSDIIACQRGYSSILRLDVRSKKSSPPVDAAKKGSLEIVKLLLKRGADPNEQFDINLAPEIDIEEDRKWFLIVEKASVNLLTESGYIPLHFSTFGNYGLIVKIPLYHTKFHTQSEQVVDVDAKNEYDLPAVHAAAAFGHFSCVQMLAAANAKLSEKDGGGRTPLHLAAAKGYLDVVETLLRRQIDPDEMYTVLHLTAENVNLDAVKVLLASKAGTLGAKGGRAHPGQGGRHRPLEDDGRTFTPVMENRGLNVPDLDGWTPLY
ncbi:Ankyrin-2 [Metarhizium rileyi]|uniref:Ankyrin-2 n=1 Tax=Metarhizium rileyi (strain RCEF 4871) TaxID=1649241 RepID=A0A5C6FZU7_METRR|nr:Ankyrin-2 [Metarhizium rileyi]